MPSSAPRRNAKPGKPTLLVWVSKYLDRAETNMHWMKLLAQRLMARDFDR